MLDASVDGMVESCVDGVSDIDDVAEDVSLKTNESVEGMVEASIDGVVDVGLVAEDV